ncbi:MAG: hypothetical protein CML16_00050 [Pusillimonas sp.]|nr:hypothetical protein [Pusillimonas sp.]|tara:strand:+ start:6024 stop:6287 length:264 start_codon:yes stop_codon:yes gene_type:complete
MKTIRKKWLLPIMAFSIAIAGAFASNLETKSNAPVAGFLDHPQPCKIAVQCSNSGNILCTSGGQLAKRMNEFGTACNVDAFKYIPGQ